MAIHPVVGNLAFAQQPFKSTVVGDLRIVRFHSKMYGEWFNVSDCLPATKTSSTAKPHSTNARHFTESMNYRSTKRCGEFQRSTVRLWTGSLGLEFRRETFFVDKFPFVCHSFQRMG